MTQGREAPVEVVVWADAAHAPAVGRLFDVMAGRVQLLAVGGPRGEAVTRLAQAFGLSADDDLRHLLATHPAAFALLAAHDAPALDDLRGVVAQGSALLPLEPVVEDLDTLAKVDAQGPLASMLCPAPSMLASPGFVSAAEPFDILGDVRTVQLESIGAPGQGSLFARLFDAWLTALALVDLPETIDAQYAAGTDATGQSLRDLTGRITAHGRLPDGGAVSILAADRAAEHRRRLTVIAAQAQLDVDDARYDLRRIGGQVIDASPEADGPTPGYTDLIAAGWRRRIERLAAGGAPADAPAAARVRDALACCHAAALSARTAQPEDPRAILRMAMT